jgi:hypothetical protein
MCALWLIVNTACVGIHTLKCPEFSERFILLTSRTLKREVLPLQILFVKPVSVDV